MSSQRFVAFGLTACVVLAISQASGYLVQARLMPNETYVVNGVLHFTHLRNTGAIFGLFPGNSLLFAITSSLTILALCAYLLKWHVTRGWQFVCVGCIAGAAASNVLDRLLYGAVIDFIDVQGVPYWHYVFNVADAAIHAGAWPLVLSGFWTTRAPTEASPGE